jgi:hypothetical protein
MPLALVLAYMHMLPRLHAEDQLAAVRVAQLGGSAQFPIDEVKSQVRTLEDAANPNRPRRRAAKATPEALAAMGIGLVSVPVEERLSDG